MPSDAAGPSLFVVALGNRVAHLWFDAGDVVLDQGFGPRRYSGPRLRAGRTPDAVVLTSAGRRPLPLVVVGAGDRHHSRPAGTLVLSPGGPTRSSASVFTGSLVFGRRARTARRVRTAARDDEVARLLGAAAETLGADAVEF